MKHRLQSWAVPLLATTALAAARVVPAPALSDPTGAALPDGVRLSTPWLHVVAAPVFTLWDGMSMLSMSRLVGCVYGVVGLFVLWRLTRLWRHRRPLRELGIIALGLAGFVLFLVTGAIWHRPMVALTGVPAGTVAVDVHSHSNASHDVDGLMRNWDVRASRRWHARAGFDAFFLTDHNTQAPAPRDDPPGPPYVCPGIEISAWRAHILLLGTRDTVNRRPYTKSLDGVLTLLADANPKYGAVSIASIPEYERYHWNNLEAWVEAGLGGFEVVNASPKANELSRARRDSVIALARRTNRLVVGASDQHGWGATSMVWNLVALAGDVGGGTNPCLAILRRLSVGGFGAVQIVERHRLRADSGWPVWLTAPGVVWETWRATGWPATIGWLVWIWIAAAGGSYMKRRRRLVSNRVEGPELSV